MRFSCFYWFIMTLVIFSSTNISLKLLTVFTDLINLEVTLSEVILSFNALYAFLSGGPENVSTSISPATALSNGTLYTDRGSSVTLRCSGSSYPSQHLTWAFSGDSSSNDSLVSGSGSSLEFTIQNIQPSAQGVYSCMAHNPVSNVTVISRKELLVYCKYHKQDNLL